METASMISTIFCGSPCGPRPGRSDIGRDSLKRHNGDGTGLLGELCLLCVDDVHNNAAVLQRRKAALDQLGAKSQFLEFHYSYV